MQNEPNQPGTLQPLPLSPRRLHHPMHGAPVRVTELVTPAARCSTAPVADPQQHSFVLDLESGGQSGLGLYRPGCTCGGWTYKDLVRPDSPEA